MKSPTSRLSRRNFLLAAGAGGVATVAAVGKSGPGVQPKKSESAGGGAGYHVTDHIRKYYNTAKV